MTDSMSCLPDVSRVREIMLSCLLAAMAVGAPGDCLAVQRDPTRPPDALLTLQQPAAAPVAPMPVLELQLILRQAQRAPVALINGKQMRIGQQVDGVRLLALGPAHADVLAGGKTARLSLTPAVITTQNPALPADAGATTNRSSSP